MLGICGGACTLSTGAAAAACAAICGGKKIRSGGWAGAEGAWGYVPGGACTFLLSTFALTAALTAAMASALAASAAFAAFAASNAAAAFALASALQLALASAFSPGLLESWERLSLIWKIV